MNPFSNPFDHKRVGRVGSRRGAAGPRRKSGQTLIFMTLVVVMIAFAALFYFDVHKTLHVKAVSRNAGDAAALAGARWQAVSLNLVGSLNMAQAIAMTDALTAGETQSPEADAIADLQRRITFSGPLFGFLVSQQAAKNNGIFNQETFERSIASHVERVRTDYVTYFPEPFQAMPPFDNAWDEYADMLTLLVQHGVAVNAAWQYYRNYAHMNHLLLNPGFYDAIAGRSWCWFYHNAYDELRNYNSWLDWDELPPIRIDPPINSEVYSLHLRRVRVLDSLPRTPPPGSTWEDTIEALNQAYSDADPELLEDFNADWAFYSSGRWSSWTSRIPRNFPWDGEVRPEFDYAGADAAVQILTETERHTDFRGGDTVNWTAGAKPFGFLPGEDGPVRPTEYGLVFPAFTDVRLIPIDTTVSGGTGALRPGWLEFIMDILPRYVAQGPSALPPGNWYAQQLRTWENREFREFGVQWLLANSARCHQPPPGPGGGGTGGTFHGH